MHILTENWGFLLKLFVKYFQVSNTLLIVNSSVNFIFYCMVGTAFRAHLFEMLSKYFSCICKWFQRSSNGSTPTNTRPTVNFEMNSEEEIEVDANGLKLEDQIFEIQDTPIIKPSTVPEVAILDVEPIDSIQPYHKSCWFTSLKKKFLI